MGLCEFTFYTESPLVHNNSCRYKPKILSHEAVRFVLQWFFQLSRIQVPTYCINPLIYTSALWHWFTPPLQQMMARVHDLLKLVELRAVSYFLFSFVQKFTLIFYQSWRTFIGFQASRAFWQNLIPFQGAASTGRHTPNQDGVSQSTHCTVCAK